MPPLETQLTADDIEMKHYCDYLLSEKKNYSVSRVSYIDGFSEVDLPVAIAYRPNSKVLSQSAGKGISRNQSLISALMESYECDAAEKIKPDQHLISESYLKENNLKFISPEFLSITLSSYRKHMCIEWCEGQNIISKQKCLVPFHAVSLDFTLMAKPDYSVHMQLTSNGLASGKSREQATVSALYEIIERHSITSHEINNLERSRPVDILSIPIEIQNKLIDKIVSHDINVFIYDVTVWEEFPTYACHISDNVGFYNVGWGCHVDPAVSLARAVTEANQARTIQISGSREDMNKYDYFSIKRKNEPANATDFSQYVNYRSRVYMNSPDSIQIAELIFQYRGIDPVAVCVDERKDMSVVRVVTPRLHGYNYPAYRSTMSKSFKESILGFELQPTHKPAAG